MTVSPTFAHIVLQTNQLEPMRDFYLALLGAHVVYEGNSMVFITFDEEHHRIAFFGPPGGGLPERSPATVGLAHSAFTFPSLHDLMDKYTELVAMGIEPRVAVQHGVTTSLYYRDPDGNAVEMQIDNFKTADEATTYMLGPEYENDPVGRALTWQRRLRHCSAATPCLCSAAANGRRAHPSSM